MPFPHEGDQSAYHNQPPGETYEEILDLASKVGWYPEGSVGDDLFPKIELVRMENRNSISPAEAIVRLNLAEPDGALLPGYDVATDPETGRLALSYEGPYDSWYSNFLESAIKLGAELDKATIAASPYPEALEQWRWRREYWSLLPKYYTLEPHLSEELKAVRDHVAIEQNGVTRLLCKIAEYTASDEKKWIRDAFDKTGMLIQKALALENPVERDEKVSLALQVAEDVIRSVVEAKETEALNDPEVAAAFAREVLVENPRNSEPLDEEKLTGLLAFQDDERTTKAEKLTFLGRVSYYVHTSTTPTGLWMLFKARNMDLLEGQTVWGVIDKGSPERRRQLYDWVVGLRSSGGS